MGRLTSTSTVTPDGKGNASHTYTYGRNGARATVDGVSYVYDDLGRLIRETDGSTVKEYTYDAADNRKTFVLKQDNVVKVNTSYTYDSMNRLYKVFDDNQLVATYTYDDNGNRESLQYANGNSVVYGYNLANKLIDLTNLNGASELSHYSYEYYLDGNQSQKEELVSGKTSEYVYDGLSRLIAEREYQNGTIVSAMEYTYDDYSNRKTLTATGNENFVTEYDYDLCNRLLTETKTAGDILTITRYGYDDNGNQIYKGTETIEPDEGMDEALSSCVAGEDDDGSVSLYEYDGFNQLTKAISGDITAEYSYNADGLRTSKTINGITTRHIWDGDQISLELDGNGAVTAKYIRGINLIYAEDAAGTNLQYYLFNGHGDVVQLTGTDGSVTENYDYDAFGNEKDLDSADTNPFRYCGEYFDKETSSYYLRAR